MQLNPGKEGFTLLELIVVIIIIGVLATLGVTQYTMSIEKGRTAEAKNVLSLGLKLQAAFYMQNGVYGTHNSTTDDIGLGSSVPGCNGGVACYNCSNTNYFFNYYCRSDAGERCLAYRCTSGGKTPNASAAYYISVYDNGTWGGTAGYY